ncbi:uncharacterized protein LOC135224976 [Macrobrachium nipponense]|uniref:uncharacterized protein LOC135224976 n=1 Tax=Macrobrachium nipponense TaxID=159736 RepID=UPI0030C81D42
MIPSPMIFFLLGTAIAQGKENDTNQLSTDGLGKILAVGDSGVSADVDVISNITIKEDATCSSIALEKPITDISVSRSCCNFGTEQCWYFYNGVCMTKWETGSCDYTVDKACDLWGTGWPCTCCGSCDTPFQENSCSAAGNTCRRKCYKHEYFAWWHSCSHDHCRCCRKYCQQETCADGRGRCLHKSEKRPRGWYFYGTCEGLDCRCYVPCSYSRECNIKGGFCEWKKAICPLGYTQHRCKCEEDSCKCCSKISVMDPTFRDSRPIKIESSNHMEIDFGGGRIYGESAPEAKNGDEVKGQALQEQYAKEADAAEESESGPMDDESDHSK